MIVTWVFKLKGREVENGSDLKKNINFFPNLVGEVLLVGKC